MVQCAGRSHVTQLYGFINGECQSHLKQKSCTKRKLQFQVVSKKSAISDFLHFYNYQEPDRM